MARVTRCPDLRVIAPHFSGFSCVPQIETSRILIVHQARFQMCRYYKTYGSMFHLRVLSKILVLSVLSVVLSKILVLSVKCALKS